MVEIKINTEGDYHIVEILLNGKFLKEIYPPDNDITSTLNCVAHSLKNENLNHP